MIRHRLAPALVALALFACASVARAASDTPRMPLSLEGDESVATTDDARAILVNPAAVGVCYPFELYEGFARHDPMREWNTTLLSIGHVGVLALRERDTLQAYGVAFSLGSEALRFGASPYLNESTHPIKENRLDWRVGVLSRPLPGLSLGLTVDRLFQPIFRAEHRARHITLGAGLRPLAFVPSLAHGWGTRFTLSTDLTIVDDGVWGQARVRCAGELEALPGVALKATVGDHRTVRAGITLRGVGWSAHGGTAAHAGSTQYQTYALSTHDGEERSVFATPAERRVGVVRASGVLADEAIGGVSLEGGASATASSRPLHRQLQRALEDPLTRGVLLELRGVGGMAQLEELRPRLERLRAAGKPVVAWMEYGGGRPDLYLASACDRAIATESAEFAPLGLRTERRYWRAALARVGVRMERSSIGAFKSAYRNQSVDSMPAADSVTVLRDLEVRQKLFVDAVGSGRRLTSAALEPFLDGRARTGAELARGGVIDTTGWRDDALRAIGQLSGLGARPRTIDLASARGAHRTWALPAPIAIVYAGGGIARGRSGNDLLDGPFMGERTVTSQLEGAFRDPAVRAVVLRIESPGGEVLASDFIDHTIVRLKRETKKPLIVSMGSVAASGGYYIACHADWIVADRHTRTGSIGVLYRQPSFEQLYRKLDVRQESFDRGAYMPGTSWSHDWTAQDQAAADSVIARDYERFVARVAEGRHMDPDSVRVAAQGRVWMGEDALAHHLVDQLGGLEDALDEAARRANLPRGERIRYREFGRPRPPLLERLLGGMVRDVLATDARIDRAAGAQYRDEDGAGPIVE